MLRQYGHSFCVGAAGASGFFPMLRSLLTCFTVMNTTKAISRKLIVCVIKDP